MAAGARGARRWEGPFRLNNDRMAAGVQASARGARPHRRGGQIADAEHAPHRRVARDQLRGPGRDVEFFDRLLDDYARGQRAEHDRKSISTPHGTVATRAVKATGKLRDEAAPGRPSAASTRPDQHRRGHSPPCPPLVRTASSR